MNIIENIKKLREGKGFSQDDIAKKVGISRTLLSQIENGTKKMSADLTPKFAKALGVSLEYLFSTNISSPNDFSNKIGIMREYTYINQERIRTLLSSTGKYQVSSVRSETEKSIDTKAGTSTLLDVGYGNNSSSKVTAELVKNISNEASELITWLNENSKINYDLDIKDYIPNQIYELDVEIELSNFEKSIDTLSGFIDMFTAFSSFSKDSNTNVADVDMIKKILELFKDSNSSYIVSKYNGRKYIGKILKKHLLVEDTNNFEGSSKILCKISKVIPSGSSYPIISEQIKKLIDLSGDQKFYEIFQGLSKLGIVVEKDDIFIPGEAILFEPIIIYK